MVAALPPSKLQGGLRRRRQPEAKLSLSNDHDLPLGLILSQDKFRYLHGKVAGFFVKARQQNGYRKISKQQPTTLMFILFTLQNSVFREPSSSLLPKGEGFNVPNFEVR